MPEAVGAALERIFCAEQSDDEALAQVAEPAILAAAMDALRERGCLVPAGQAAAAAPPDGRVAVGGEGIVAGHLSDLLREGAVRVVRFPSDARDDAFEGIDVLVACAGWLPDADWVRLDERAEAHGVAWHRVHREGGRWFLGPLTIAGRTATYRDTRARRLAAAHHPDELESAWAALDRHGRRPPPDSPTGAVAAIVAGLLAADVMALLSGAAPPSERHQIEFDPATLELRRHPVLPLPHGIATMDATARTWNRAAR
ncbi:MAG: TOMM precursor leader peptide-binding protein [Solirubrobacteraceae bacterium]